MKKKILTLLAISSFIWVACSSDSSSAQDPTPEPTTENSSSSSEENDEELVLDSIGFADIANAYHTVATDEKVVFVLRHAERESFVSVETPLTDDGILQAQLVGQKLSSSDSVVYAHTAYVRTKETACNIALGRGQVKACDDSFVSDTIAELTGSWFLKDADLRNSYVTKDTNTTAVVALWLYDSLFADAFYDLDTRGKEVVDTYLIKDYAKMPKVKVVISHDEFVMPLIAYGTQKQAVIRYRTTGRWKINYLAGVAIIVNSKNEVRYIAVKGLDSAIEQ